MLADLLIDTLRLPGSGPGELAARWSKAKTTGLLDLVAREGAGIWLFRRLRATESLDVLPADFQDGLRRGAFEAAAFKLEVEAEGAEVLEVLVRAGVPVILIKGMARCALAAQCPYLDARATLDVDLLVPTDRAVEAEAALRASGYRSALAPDEPVIAGHHHLPPLHKGRVTVELHESTSARVPAAVAWIRAAEGSRQLNWAGHSVRVPSETELAWSAVAHAMEDEASGFRLKRFLEVAALAAGRSTIDWTELLRRSSSGEAFDQGLMVENPSAVIAWWLGAAGALIAVERRPPEFAARVDELGSLLSWRGSVLRRQPAFGRAFTERLLAEGTRALVGLPIEGSPPGAALLARARRRTAAHIGRGAFRCWRAAGY